MPRSENRSEAISRETTERLFYSKFGGKSILEVCEERDYRHFAAA
jgi:hypothetical protein